MRVACVSRACRVRLTHHGVVCTPFLTQRRLALLQLLCLRRQLLLHVRRVMLALHTNKQPQVKAAPEFLVFCADLNRAIRCCDWHQATATKGFTEQFILASVDTALCAQNVVVAAESIGLGICYIGAVRNEPQLASDLLELPDHVYPVFGLCLGYPDQDPEVKPRLPLSVMFKENSYDTDQERADIAAYDQVVRAYYASRTGNPKSQSWSEQMAGLLGKEARPHMREFLRKRGFEMK